MGISGSKGRFTPCVGPAGRPNIFAPMMPISYNTINGTAINNMVNNVASGVTIAEMMSAAMMACLRYCASTVADTTPTRDNNVSTRGSSKAQPKISRNFTLKSM